VNHISITGRLTRDPELRSLSSGDPVCSMRLAVDGMAPGRETGYIDVAAFGKPGEACARVLTRGWLVAVDGRLEHRTWETADGQARQSYQLVGSVEFLAAPRSNGGGHGGDDDAAADEALAAARDVDQPAPAGAKPRRKRTQPAAAVAAAAGDSDEIPF
jgi:single-strand DNA-binding protein